MTEAEFLASDDVAAMLQLRGSDGNGFTDRKLRLFACACVRRVWSLLQDERSRKAVEVAERFADGEASGKELAAAHSAAHSTAYFAANSAAYFAAWAAASAAASYSAYYVANSAAKAAAYSAERCVQCDMLRDVFGNPFRPVTLPEGPAVFCRRCQGDGWNPSDDGWGDARDKCKVCDGTGTLNLFGPCPWLTPDVVSLAQAAYKERNPDGTLDPLRLSILADALTDAGCPTEIEEQCSLCGGAGVVEDEVGSDYPCIKCSSGGRLAGTGRQKSPHPIIAHLRSPGPHVRGCFVIDLILGKE